MPIRGVIFDFYGTLAESAGAGLAWADLFSEIGHTLSQDAIDRLWNQGNDGVEHLEHSQSRDHYVAWQQARLRQIIAESGVPEGDDDLLFARMTELLGTQDLAVYPESRRNPRRTPRPRGPRARDLLELELGPARSDRQRRPDGFGRRHRVVGLGGRTEAPPSHLRGHAGAARPRPRRHPVRRRHVDLRRRGAARGRHAAGVPPPPALRCRPHATRGRRRHRRHPRRRPDRPPRPPPLATAA